MSTAHKFYVPVGVVPLAAPPADPTVGETYFDTSRGELRSWDGSAWIAAAPGEKGDATGVWVQADEPPPTQPPVFAPLWVDTDDEEEVSAVAGHEAAEDPHPQYLTKTAAAETYQPASGGGGGGPVVPVHSPLMMAHSRRPHADIPWAATSLSNANSTTAINLSVGWGYLYPIFTQWDSYLASVTIDITTDSESAGFDVVVYNSWTEPMVENSNGPKDLLQEFVIPGGVGTKTVILPERTPRPLVAAGLNWVGIKGKGTSVQAAKGHSGSSKSGRIIAMSSTHSVSTKSIIVYQGDLPASIPSDYNWANVSTPTIAITVGFSPKP